MRSAVQLPPALPGPCRILDGDAGPLAFYGEASTDVADSRPLLLIHSINAAASAYEVRPLFEHYATRRPVHAIDLPGYGLSDRSDREYSIRLMTDAVLDAVDAIAALHGPGAIDAIAVSLSCEYLARAATERPAAFRSVTLVSATGLDGRKPFYGPPGSSRGFPWLLSWLGKSRWSDALFRLLTRRGVIRFFLRKTFGSKTIDDGLLEYDVLTAQQPGARHAPFHFLSAFLFAADITRVYEQVAAPVLLVHGTRGDFVRYPDAKRLARVAGWTIEVMETGAMPYFEYLDGFVARYEAFLQAHGVA
jgi:pimeloyl-ACP methyl ester carboxylesterase